VFNATKGSVREWVAKQTGGRGLDVVITAAPAREVQAEAIELLAPYGRLSLFAGLPANGGGTAELNTNAIHYKALTVTGTTGGAPADYRAALDLISSGKINLRPIVSHIFPLRDVARAYETALAGKGMKIILADDEQFALAAKTHGEAVVK
jgi:threonine dehydrogenase-like Zn-dependent dehydrogenase